MCGHENVQPIGYFRQMVTQAVEEMKYYYDGEGQIDDAELIVVDRTYPITIWVERCPDCGLMWQSDALGGLGELDRLPKGFVEST